jgi:hypothetical protein
MYEQAEINNRNLYFVQIGEIRDVGIDLGAQAGDKPLALLLGVGNVCVHKRGPATKGGGVGSGGVEAGGVGP